MSEKIHLSGHIGETDLIQYPHTAFLCSRNVPSQNVKTILEWAQGFTDQTQCIVCGCQTSIEYQVVQTLLHNCIPVIVVFSTAIPKITDKEWTTAIDEGRLLLLSEQVDEKPSNDAYLRRNSLILELSSHIVVGYCTRGGNIAHQMLGRSDVTFLTSYNEYDNMDRSLWSKTLRMSDGGTMLMNLRTLNQKESYLELTKSFYSQETHKTEYTSIFIPQSDINQIIGMMMDADMMQRNYKAQKELVREHVGLDLTETEAPMPWDDDVKSQIIRLSHDGLTRNQISRKTGATMDLINSILGIEA